MNNKQFYEYLVASAHDKTLPALSWKNNLMSYQELFENVDNVSNKLSNKAYWILNGEKSFDYIVLLLACVKKGVPFVPVAYNAPAERVRYIKSELEKNKKSVGIVEKIKDLDNDYGGVLDSDNKEAYVIFTSGSTGVPKGVRLHYKGLYNIIKEQQKAFNMNKDDRFLWLLSTG